MAPIPGDLDDGPFSAGRWPPKHADRLQLYSFPTPNGVRALVTFYEAGELVGFGDLRRVLAWLERVLARPAVQRGLVIPG